MPALLFGAPTEGLMGIDADLDAMAALTPSLGLGEPIVERRATLASIRRRLSELLARPLADEPVLIYLTGHGGFTENRDYDPRALRPAPQRLYHFVPVPQEGRRELLFEVELSLWCARLAALTPNVAVIVDCCHASGVVRDHETDPRASRRAREVIRGESDPLAGFRAWRAEHQDEIDALDVEAHPDIVRLSAAGVNGMARPGRDGSALTRALFETLAEAGACHLSWIALFSRIERRLEAEGIAQQPRLSGPIRRRVFGITEAVPPGALPVRRETDRLVLGGGAEQGVRLGELFMVTGGGAQQVAEVEAVEPARSTLRLRGAAIGEGDPTELFAVPLHVSRAATGAERLLCLGGTTLASLGLRASWGRVRAGVCERLDDGAEIDAGDPIYVRIENTSWVRRFVSVFWLSDDGDTALLSRSESMGVEVSGGSTFLLGDRPFARAPRGVVPPRRDHAPGGARREQIVIVAGARRQMLWSFDAARHAGPAQGEMRVARDAGTTAAEPMAVEMLSFLVSRR
jgi:hypothetical protein